jgi:DNA repair exonuclease SbcCD ATPase subunit
MSPIGRTFIALNFGLSCAFLAFSAYYLNNAATYKGQYDAEVTAHVTDNQNNSDRIKQLEGEKKTAQQDASAHKRDADDRKTRIDELQEELKSAQAAEATNRSNLAQMANLLSGVKDTLNQQSERVRTTTDKWMTAIKDKDSAVTERDDMQEALTTVKGQLGRTESRNEQLLAQVKSLQTELEDKLTMIELAKTKVPALAAIIGDVVPDIDAKITAVKPELGTVVLNVGSENGKVSNGYTFKVFEGGKYKGDVQVIDVTEAACYAKIIASVKGASIGVGDSASTRLK